jgi:hypothetical protein
MHAAFLHQKAEKSLIDANQIGVLLNTLHLAGVLRVGRIETDPRTAVR